MKADGRGLAHHREADLPGPAVAHALVASGTTDGCACAVARQRLPAQARWQGFLPAPD